MSSFIKRVEKVADVNALGPTNGQGASKNTLGLNLNSNSHQKVRSPRFGNILAHSVSPRVKECVEGIEVPTKKYETRVL